MRHRIEGLENVPASGPAVVVSNHLHNADPVIIVASFPRPVRFMAKKEVFRVPIAAQVAQLSGAFPVDRGTVDRWALRAAQYCLDSGALVGVFPEGTRSVTGGLKDVFAGAAMIVVRSGVPVIPTAIFGTETLPFNGAKGRRSGKTQVTVRIGKPFMLQTHDELGQRRDLRELTDEMMIEVARLLPPQYRGIYADRVDDTEDGMPADAIRVQQSEDQQTAVVEEVRAGGESRRDSD